MALTDPWSGEDDDTGYDYYDTPSGNIWRPGAGPGRPGDEPGRPRHAAGDVVGAGTGPGGSQPTSAAEPVMCTLDPATRLSGAELAVTRAGPPLRVRLPAGRWQVGFRAQHDGRTVIEVTGQDGSLAGLVASSRLPILSVDAGWYGAASERDGGRRWWALAIGHVPAGQGQPSVTFTRRLPGARRAAVRPDAVDGLWVTVDGLWVAAAPGRYTAVRCAAGSVTLTRRLRPVTARLAPW